MTYTSGSKVRGVLVTGALALGVLTATLQAFGQGKIVKVDVPFGFENGSQHLPAGNYRIELRPDNVMYLSSSANGGGFAMTLPTEQKNAPEQGKVVFHKYGDKYFLGEVWVAGNPTGYKCFKSRTESRTETAMNAATRSNVQVAVNAPSR